MSRLRALLIALVATSAIVSAIVVGFGWLLIDRQQDLDVGRVRAERDAAADTMVAGVRARFAEIGDRLSAGLASSEAVAPATDAGVMVMRRDRDGRIRITPSGGLPFLPETQEVPIPNPAFAKGEAVEFQAKDLSEAAAIYAELAKATEPSLQAGALVRLGRVLRKSHDLRGALHAYVELTSFVGVMTDGLPAELIGLDGQRRLYTAQGDREREHRAAAALAAGLDAGRWPLSRGTATRYRDALPDIPKPDRWMLAEVVSDAWSEIARAPAPRGLRAILAGNRGVILIWRSIGSAVALAAFPAESLITPIASTRTSWQMLDAEGHRIAGDPNLTSGHATRMAGVADGAWELRVKPPVAPMGGGRSVLVAMLVATLVFIWVATYLMARAIQREATVARLQSDFVAAVSHEFRSPLTSVRQMGEMLEMGRLQSDERRQLYYRGIVVETTRLQRLVEQVLNFGRLESRDVEYSRAPVEIGEVVDLAVADVRPQTQERGTTINVSRAVAPVVVHADGDALRLALRNLVENAVKYSPAGATVGVRWWVEGDHVAVAVTDRGPGVLRGEREAIFRKFVRGRAARDGHVKGTGVGLAIVQHVVRAHRGDIDVESDAGQGSTFTLRLPHAQPSDASLSQGAPATTPAATRL